MVWFLVRYPAICYSSEDLVHLCESSLPVYDQVSINLNTKYFLQIRQIFDMITNDKILALEINFLPFYVSAQLVFRWPVAIFVMPVTCYWIHIKHQWNYDVMGDTLGVVEII